MNEIFLDTETTGLSFKDGHKIVEVACVETSDLIPTNKKRNSDTVLREIKNSRESTEKFIEIRNIATRFIEFEDDREYKIEEVFNQSVRDSWLLKKSMSQIMNTTSSSMLSIHFRHTCNRHLIILLQNLHLMQDSISSMTQLKLQTILLNQLVDL